MASSNKVQTELWGFFDNIRISQHARGIEHPGGVAAQIPAQVTEGKRIYSAPGRMQDTGNLDLYIPQTADYDRILEIVSDCLDVPVSVGDGSAVGNLVWLTTARFFARNLSFSDNRSTISTPYSISANFHNAPGEVRYTSVGTAGVTGADAGTGKQYVGGIAAGERMVAMLHPYLHSGAAGTAVVRLESASDSGFTTDLTTEKTWTILDSGGGQGFAGESGAAATSYFDHDGDDDGANTNDYWRFNVISVSAGTFYFVGTIAHFTKTDLQT